MKGVSVGVLTISDSCYSGVSEDKSGPGLVDLLCSKTRPILGPSLKVERVEVACVPDDRAQIESQLIAWSDDVCLDLVFTTGGTGVSPRDVTPEATRSVISREVWGLAHTMVAKSVHVTPTAMLSRPVCGLRGQTMIINLPGSRKGSGECLQFIAEAIPHALDLVRGDKQRVVKTHAQIHGSGIHVEPPASPNHGGRCKSKVDSGQVALRDRHSPFPMQSVEKALEIVFKEARAMPQAQISMSYKDAFGFILAENVQAREPFPPFPASVKDGYAVLSCDGAGVREVIDHSDAGDEVDGDVALQPGCCVRINTGAPVPAGADAVVQVEDTKLARSDGGGWRELQVEICVAPTPGQDIRPIGCDITRDELVLEEGARLGASEIALLATVGVTRVTVYGKPRVAVLSTGNELVTADHSGQGPRSGQIRDSNKDLLLQTLRSHAFYAVDAGIARDDADSVLSHLEHILGDVDVIITTGGVSMGERDVVKQVLLQDLEATMHFARVFMKPGKPTVFSTLTFNDKRKLVFSLPGNPVSAAVTCQLYVLPALKIISGWREDRGAGVCLPRVTVKLGQDVRLDPRPEYCRAVLCWGGDGPPVATTTGSQCSSRLVSMRSANCLLQLPPASEDRTVMKAGDTVQALLLSL